MIYLNNTQCTMYMYARIFKCLFKRLFTSTFTLSLHKIFYVVLHTAITLQLIKTELRKSEKKIYKFFILTYRLGVLLFMCTQFTSLVIKLTLVLYCFGLLILIINNFEYK